MRGWYQVSSGVYTFADYATPYLGTAGQPQYLDTDTYTLTNVGATDFARYWVYAADDTTRHMYIIPTQAATAYNNIVTARTEDTPEVLGLNINADMKLLYSFIYKGNGEFQESEDYRTSSTVPGGGVETIPAGSVSFMPTGDVAATDVQTAIGEVDTEKAALAGADFTGAVDVADALTADSVTADAVEDPAIFYDALDAQDTDWYTGTNADAGASSDDAWEIRTSATPGTNVFMSIDPITGSISATSFDGTVGAFTTISASTGLSADLPYNEVHQVFNNTLTSDNIASGDIITVTFGESVVFGQCTYPNATEDEWMLALATNVAAKHPCMGVVLESKANGESGKLLLRGTIRDATYFSSVAMGDIIYLSDSSAGNYVLAAPGDSGDIVQIVGFGLGTNIIFFSPDYTYVEIP